MKRVIGIHGDGIYKAHTPCYETWRNMLARCYDETVQKKQPDLAFQAYKLNKEAYIKHLADYYKDTITKACYNALYNWEITIKD